MNRTLPPRTLAIAPMMDWTDRHCRYLHRLLSRHTWLYTEMVTTGALLHADPRRWLEFDPVEHPVALQLGGSDPAELAQCARLGADMGYDEINLNVGCPSDRVTTGRFGACLMAEPQLVAECVAAMSAAVNIPVSVKTRVGIDEQDSYEQLHQFVRLVADAGCRIFIIHARKAWLTGLSPKENRTVPPLRYDLVFQLKHDFPALTILLNGGITTLDAAAQALQHVDGVMIGRSAYHQPSLLAHIDPRFYDATASAPKLDTVIERYAHYMVQQQQRGVRIHAMTRHTLGLLHGLPGARIFRRYLSDHAPLRGADARVLIDAWRAARQHAIDADLTQPLEHETVDA